MTRQQTMANSHKGLLSFLSISWCSELQVFVELAGEQSPRAEVLPQRWEL